MTLLPVPHASGALDPSSAAARLIDTFLRGRKSTTIRAYRSDLLDFARFIESPTIDAAATLLLARGHGEANALALSYRAHLIERGLAPATTNRRLAALRSLVALGRTLGMVAWELECQGQKSESYRDTAGPGRTGFARMKAEGEKRTDRKGRRDQAILRLLHDLGLRRAEVCGLDLEDLDLERGTVAILGKGRTEKERLTLPGPTKAVLETWLAVRPKDRGTPLFVNLDRARQGNRLTGNGLYRIIRALGEKVGIRTRPHGLRHLAISNALDLTGGDVRAVQKFSRHRDVRVIQRYDDARQDLAGDVARRVAEAA